ncbi:hypothetical protein PYV61_25795, partial [Roseisolibacter sp. H3M3-2]
DAPDAAAAAPAYARGWHGVVGAEPPRGAHVGTVMSHVGRRIPYFSSPRVRYRGVAVGSDSADNARALDGTRTP